MLLWTIHGIFLSLGIIIRISAKEDDIMTNKNVIANRLINEKSPYLLQHAYNPVNWYSVGR